MAKPLITIKNCNADSITAIGIKVDGFIITSLRNNINTNVNLVIEVGYSATLLSNANT